MSIRKPLGGERLGAGKKMDVSLHNYERSTHDLGYLWRSSMSAGTLVPFISEVALPGDTFDIKLDCDVKTHPTIGPLFGSFKVQLDTFLCPIRLYNSLLHNNMLGIGLDMSRVKLPQLAFPVFPYDNDTTDIDNSQTNPSSLLAYLGIRGGGYSTEGTQRLFNAVPYLSYFDIYKNYYANKQEEIGAIIHTALPDINETIDTVKIDGLTLSQAPTNTPTIGIFTGSQILVEYTGATPSFTDIFFNTADGKVNAQDILSNINTSIAGEISGTYNGSLGSIILINWRYRNQTDIYTAAPDIQTFPLSNIDEMRKMILADSSEVTPFTITSSSLTPYQWCVGSSNGQANTLNTQEGLLLKTYQSDIFNNWLQTEWFDGTGGINEITAIDTSGGSFTIDTLNLSQKVYKMLNRIAVSGGSYYDWQEAVYAHQGYRLAETPMYMGGLSKELVFQEVISNAQSSEQPLGTLGGRGILAKKHKGGDIYIRVDEPSYIIGIVSLTPRIDYSQGNRWDVNLETMDDLHKPALDEIGFQDLITERMAWWGTMWNNSSDVWETFSAGKQPAWINYMTNYNRTYGNFAIADNEMFMTLNRRYERHPDGSIQDLTTYIDPTKYNFIFAETALDAQNFWVQIAVDITARRKMSAKVMPNL